MKREEVPNARRILNLDKVRTGRIECIKRHPYADNLRIAQVEVEGKIYQIVFGGPEIEMIGATAMVALPGALTGSGKLKKRKFRGVVSEAMICSAVELGLVEEGPDEIIICNGADRGSS